MDISARSSRKKQSLGIFYILLFFCMCNVARVCSVRYRYSRYRYRRRTEPTELSGTGIDVVTNLPNCPVPVSEVYRADEVCGTGIDAVPN